MTHINLLAADADFLPFFEDAKKIFNWCEISLFFSLSEEMFLKGLFDIFQDVKKKRFRA